jgi:endogenous inhibitor of DNA gyrase (YacG/DUF329 family)
LFLSREEQAVAEVRCPNCGREVPEELGQHSVTPVSGLVTCPHCGAEVELGAIGDHEVEPGGGGGKAEAASGGKHDSFSGHETVEGLRDELKDKP